MPAKKNEAMTQLSEFVLFSRRLNSAAVVDPLCKKVRKILSLRVKLMSNSVSPLKKRTAILPREL